MAEFQMGMFDARDGEENSSSGKYTPICFRFIYSNGRIDHPLRFEPISEEVKGTRKKLTGKKPTPRIDWSQVR